jgi:hypothetical protein
MNEKAKFRPIWSPCVQIKFAGFQSVSVSLELNLHNQVRRRSSPTKFADEVCAASQKPNASVPVFVERSSTNERSRQPPPSTPKKTRTRMSFFKTARARVRARSRAIYNFVHTTLFIQLCS